MDALILDFDGVISDSAPESFVVALRTYLRLHTGSCHGAVLERLDLARPQTDPLYGAFLELMPLGNRAEDFGVVLAALEGQVTLRSQEDYDAFRASLDPEGLLRFHEAFYRTRRDWSKADPGGWQHCLGPYPEFLAILERRAGQTQLAIATAKDRYSVRLLLEAYGVEHLFPEERVLDKESGVSKIAHLEHLQHSLDLEFPAMTFVDDKVNHLESVAALGVQCVLAAWGYNGVREHERARDLGHRVLDLEEFESALFS